MVAMPYILVTIITDILSLLYFCLTSAVLLSKYPVTNRYLPPFLRRRRVVAFVAHSILLVGLLSLGVFVTDTLRNVHLGSLFIFELLFAIGFAQSLVLAYQFLSKRLFLHMPNFRRHILIALCSVVMVSVPVFAVMTVVVNVFVIR